MNLRYHHIVHLMILEDSFARWKELDEAKTLFSEDELATTTYESLYENLRVGMAYIDYFTVYQTERFFNSASRGVRYKDIPSPKKSEDYVGKKGNQVDQYKQRLKESLAELLLSPPESEVRISYAPDDICAACQLKSKINHQFGRHCIDELFAIHDFIWERAFTDYITDSTSPNDSIQKIQTTDGPIVTAPIGLLRDRLFLSRLDGLMDKTMGGRFQEHLNNGVLEIVGSPGIIRATETYLRGGKEF